MNGHLVNSDRNLHRAGRNLYRPGAMATTCSIKVDYFRFARDPDQSWNFVPQPDFAVPISNVQSLCNLRLRTKWLQRLPKPLSWAQTDELGEIVPSSRTRSNFPDKPGGLLTGWRR
jgi:hypothetical protein